MQRSPKIKNLQSKRRQIAQIITIPQMQLQRFAKAWRRCSIVTWRRPQGMTKAEGFNMFAKMFWPMPTKGT
jgi:hypothetical protein